jgi:hypothetical protein
LLLVLVLLPAILLALLLAAEVASASRALAYLRAPSKSSICHRCLLTAGVRAAAHSCSCSTSPGLWKPAAAEVVALLVVLLLLLLLVVVDPRQPGRSRSWSNMAVMVDRSRVDQSMRLSYLHRVQVGKVRHRQKHQMRSKPSVHSSQQRNCLTPFPATPLHLILIFCAALHLVLPPVMLAAGP